jgi:hypothetical protein
MVDEVGRRGQDEKDEYGAAEKRHQVAAGVGSTGHHVSRCYIARMLLSNRYGEFAARIAMNGLDSLSERQENYEVFSVFAGIWNLFAKTPGRKWREDP